MAEVQPEDKDQKAYRAFICQTINPFNYPAKDRSRRLEIFEEPHLGRLMEKIRSEAKPINEQLIFNNN